MKFPASAQFAVAPNPAPDIFQLAGKEAVAEVPILKPSVTGFELGIEICAPAFPVKKAISATKKNERMTRVVGLNVILIPALGLLKQRQAVQFIPKEPKGKDSFPKLLAKNATKKG